LLREINTRKLLDIHQYDEKSNNLIHFAIFGGKIEFIDKLKYLYENEMNVENNDGNTPFHCACLQGDLAIV